MAPKDPSIVVNLIQTGAAKCVNSRLLINSKLHTIYVDGNDVWNVSLDPPLFMQGAPLTAQRFKIQPTVFDLIKPNTTIVYLPPDPKAFCVQYVQNNLTALGQLGPGDTPAVESFVKLVNADLAPGDSTPSAAGETVAVRASGDGRAS